LLYLQSSPAHFGLIFFGTGSLMGRTSGQLQSFGPTPSAKEIMQCLKAAK